jgi:hypothetical protein
LSGRKEEILQATSQEQLMRLFKQD